MTGIQMVDMPTYLFFFKLYPQIAYIMSSTTVRRFLNHFKHSI